MFDIGVVLAQDAVQAIRQSLLSVEDRSNDCYEGLGRGAGWREAAKPHSAAPWRLVLTYFLTIRVCEH